MYTKGTWSSVGVAETELPSFNVHPNPVSDILTLDGIQSAETYTVTNAQGAIVIQSSGNTVNTQVLSPGFYFIKIDGYAQQKFVVK